jgi:hypothetical protein
LTITPVRPQEVYSPERCEDGNADSELTQLCEDLVEDLLLEHLTGRHAGILNAALEFVRWHRQTQGECPEENILPAGIAEGFTEEEIAAALTADYRRHYGDEEWDACPLWADSAGGVGI